MMSHIPGILVDVGGVILCKSSRRGLVPGAIEGVRRIVELWGEKNVHLCSYISRLGGQRERKVRAALNKNKFWKRTGIHPEQLTFVNQKWGQNDKGAYAAARGCHYVIDDKIVNIISVLTKTESALHTKVAFFFATDGNETNSYWIEPCYRSAILRVPSWPAMVDWIEEHARERHEHERCQKGRRFALV
jgi:hypothetical protein